MSRLKHGVGLILFLNTVEIREASILQRLKTVSLTKMPKHHRLEIFRNRDFWEQTRCSSAAMNSRYIRPQEFKCSNRPTACLQLNVCNFMQPRHRLHEVGLARLHPVNA